MSSQRQALINLSILDKGALAACYMPFLSSPGFFVPTKRKYALGDHVFLLVQILDFPSYVPMNGRVVWVTPGGSQGNKSSGVGVIIEDTLDKELQNLIDTQLAGSLSDGAVLHTM